MMVKWKMKCCLVLWTNKMKKTRLRSMREKKKKKKMKDKEKKMKDIKQNSMRNVCKERMKR